MTEPLIERCPRPSPWYLNGLGWCLFLLGPGCGLVVGLAIGEVIWS